MVIATSIKLFRGSSLEPEREAFTGKKNFTTVFFYWQPVNLLAVGKAEFDGVVKMSAQSVPKLVKLFKFASQIIPLHKTFKNDFFLMWLPSSNFLIASVKFIFIFNGN